MKTLFLSGLLLSSTLLFAQDTREIQWTNVNALVKNNATSQQVINELGQPTDEIMTPDYTMLQYKTGSAMYMFRFNKDHMLTDLLYTDEHKDDADVISYQAVKKVRMTGDKEDIRKELGMPAMVQITKNTETWNYKYDHKNGPRNMLMVTFDRSTDKVKKYNYYADYNTAVTISSSLIGSFTKGVTEIKEVEARLGTPTKISLSQMGEEWYYRSKNTSLIVYFDAQSRMSNFMYEQKTEQHKP